MGLYQGEGLKKFIQGSKSAGQNNKTLGVFDKHQFANKKVIKIQKLVGIDVGIVRLFKRQINVKTDRFAPGFAGSFVARLHDTGSTSGDDTVAFGHEEFSDFFGYLVIGTIGLGTGRTKDGYTGADTG